jgi:Cu(I)/Ag(I) efflux system periplasmic protein CusF
MRKIASIALLAACLASPVLADEKHHKPEAGASQAAPLYEGEVRKVDKDAKKLTIKHGPLEKLDMPPMTMVFQVKDPAMLEQVKAGDRIRFDAEKVGGAFVVTTIRRAD